MTPLLPRRPWHHWTFAAIVTGVVIVTIATWVADGWMNLQKKLAGSVQENKKLASQVASISGMLNQLEHEDQYVINQKLNKNIASIESTYKDTVTVYEDLLRLKEVSKSTKQFDEAFADILTILSKHDYEEATKKLNILRSDIATEQQKIASAFTIPANVPVSNTAPAGGYSRQTVQSDIGSFLVDVVAADLGGTRVIVDTASDGTCARDCPVLPLGDYVGRNGAYAGVNGSYFCPADYPSCADKKNSFDTLLMNKNKVYFNSDNNKYSVVPAVIFGSGFIRFVGQSLEWGRDTGIDSMVANQPLLLSGGNIAFGGNSDPKMGSVGSRGFVGNRGNTVYIGVVHNVTVAGMAHVLKSLGLENALNLDSGGSVALWSGGPASPSQGGYKVGPGRSIPNAILFVKK